MTHMRAIALRLSAAEGNRRRIACCAASRDGRYTGPTHSNSPDAIQLSVFSPLRRSYLFSQATTHHTLSSLGLRASHTQVRHQQPANQYDHKSNKNRRCVRPNPCGTSDLISSLLQPSPMNLGAIAACLVDQYDRLLGLGRSPYQALDARQAAD
jgi:hypothetical protein